MKMLNICCYIQAQLTVFMGESCAWANLRIASIPVLWANDNESTQEPGAIILVIMSAVEFGILFSDKSFKVTMPIMYSIIFNFV